MTPATDLRPPPAVCPSCGAAQTRFVCRVKTCAEYRIVQCGECRLAFATPRPTPEELEAFYTQAYFRRTEAVNLGYADYRLLGESNSRAMWREAGRYTAGQIARPGRLLDVGCATGGFLAEACASGWDGTGIELSEYAVHTARSEFGLKVIHGDIFLPELPAGGFDFITMWHVVEHLLNPRATLTRARELLAPGGFLLIELPNWNSIGRIARGVRWSQLRPPEHINFFTAHSLRFALEKAGFQVVRCTTHYPSLVNEAALWRPSWPLHQAKAVIARLARGLGFGGYLRVLASKPATA